MNRELRTCKQFRVSAFDAPGFLSRWQRFRLSQAMLNPSQSQRIAKLNATKTCEFTRSGIRPIQLSAFMQPLGFSRRYCRSMANLNDLNRWLRLRNNRSGAFAVLYHAWWVSRPMANNSRSQFPSPDLAGTMSRTTNGWPTKLEDKVAAFQPIISDYCYAPGTETNKASMRADHTFGNQVVSVNVAFADGHVETHPSSVIQWQYTGLTSAFY